MPGHIHLIIRSNNEEPSELIRDFKGFTSRKMLEAIEDSGFLTEPYEWKYSSVVNYYNDKQGILEIDLNL